jgi:hypothetical protein
MRVQRILLLTLCISLSSITASAFDKGQRDLIEKSARDLYSASKVVRSNAARTIAEIGTPAVPRLLKVACGAERKGFDLAGPLAIKLLGEMKAEAAVPCLIDRLMYWYPLIGPVTMKNDKTLASVDPAFVALISIGDPGVSLIKRYLPSLPSSKAMMALRALRAINTPSAKDAIRDYVKFLENQTRTANSLLEQFDSAER